MPRKGLVEEALRQFILETISEHFSPSRSIETISAPSKTIGVSFRRTRRFSRPTKTPKGRVTDPSTDKRLKANREKTGNA